MNSLREIVEQSPRMRGLAQQIKGDDDSPQPLGPSLWDWTAVHRVLLVRLRSIGDTVLATPSIFALKRFLPHAQIDILLEGWVAPLLSGFPDVDNVITLDRASVASRAQVARRLRQTRYDVAYNLHGGTTATLLTRASGAKHRVGFKTYQYARLHNHLSPSPIMLWGRDKTHSVEQQLALVGWTGVPVTDRPSTCLGVSPEASAKIRDRLTAAGLNSNQSFALIHPAAAFATKQWAVEKFAKVIEDLAARSIPSVILVAPSERVLGFELEKLSSAPAIILNDLTLPEVVALCGRARLFVGNDSGIAHVAAAMDTPSVVIFGSSNRVHWQPWTKAPSEVVFEDMPCQPCHGYFCEKFDRPECIIRVPVERVLAAMDRVLRNAA